MFGKFKFVALAAAAAVGLSGAVDAQGRITIGTNPQGSLYYTVGGGMAAALQEYLQQQVTVQPFAGSTVYLPLVGAGEVTVGINSSLDSGAIYSGAYGNEPVEDLRMLARLWPLRVAFIVRANSDLYEVADLRGKRTVTDFAALKAVGLVNQAMIQAGGLSLDEVEGVTVSGLGDGIEGLTEGNLDATSVAVGIPLTQQAHASIPGGIRYLSITGDTATSEHIDAIFPGTYLLPVEPSPRLPEVTEPVTVVGYDVFITVSADMPEDQARRILEAVYETWPQLEEDYPAIRSGAQEDMATPSNTVPYHHASVAFFQEKGLWTEANDAREASFAD